MLRLLAAYRYALVAADLLLYLVLVELEWEHSTHDESVWSTLMECVLRLEGL